MQFRRGRFKSCRAHVTEYHIYFKDQHTDSPGWVVHADNVAYRGDWEEWRVFYREAAPVLMVNDSQIRLIAIHYHQETP